MKKRILVIGQSESFGRTGLEAAQKVIAAHQCYAMTATTALTLSNAERVQDIHLTPPDSVGKQIQACAIDIGIDVVKIGFLPLRETIWAVGDALSDISPSPLCVVDPMLSAHSGVKIVPTGAVQAFRKLIVPHATILTPNLDEARLLLSDADESAPASEEIEDLENVARAVKRLGPSYVLLWGHQTTLSKARAREHAVLHDLHKPIIVDILIHPDGTSEVLERDSLETKVTYGTRCSLTSAIASNLSCGMPMPKAVKAAIHYTSAGIQSSYVFRTGHRVIDYFHSSYKLPFAPGRFIEYLLDRDDVADTWSRHVNHSFVDQLARGTLPMASFKYYLIQDYLFLVQFARANALAAYKAKTMEDISTSASIVKHLENETKLHVDFCEDFGVTLNDLKKSEESQACTAYTRYVLDVGHSEDWLALQIAFAPCLFGYGQISQRLHAAESTERHGNPYYKWIETYIADDYVEAVRKGSDMIERHVVLQSLSRIEELVKIFVHATKMEIGFWEIGAGGT